MALKDFRRKYRLMKDVLGMNARILDYIRPYNPRRAKRVADDKFRAKKVLKKASIPVSDTYATIETREHLETFDWEKLPNSFALKPIKGFGGGGIIVTFNRNKRGNWVGIEGKDITQEDLISHVYNILDGEFSRLNLPDVALFEERIKIDKALKPYSYKGIPDIRILVFNNVPVMAMLRLPTQQSGGKGNLHQGALGVGIDMATGVTTTAIKAVIPTLYEKLIERHPDNDLPLSGIQLPFWEEILKISVKCQQVSGLGFLGVDVAIDKLKGPLVMEINARPGLGIQNANNEGLKGRLRRVEGLKVHSVSRGVRLGRDLFGGEIEEEVEETTGKKVIKTIENIKLITKNLHLIETEARIDTGAASTSICDELALKLGFKETLEKFKKIDLSKYGIDNLKREDVLEVEKKIKEDYKKEIPGLEKVKIILSSHGFSVRPVIKIEYILDDEKISSDVNIVPRQYLLYPMLVGRRDLGDKYLVEVER